MNHLRRQPVLIDTTYFEESFACVMKLSGKTQLIGLLGWPVSHSFSPAMHNAAAAAAGLDWVYAAFPVRPDNLEAAVRGLAALGIRGVNVTIPHKQTVMPLLNKIEPGAKAIGAVNTIRVTESSNQAPFLTGLNTDWSGFLADLTQKKIDFSDRDCLILGAGGSARAVAYALAKNGSRVHVLARRLEQAADLKSAVSPFVPDDALEIRPLSSLSSTAAELNAPLIVNCTPLGMSPRIESTPWPENIPFPRGSVVYDLVYNPRRTRLLDQAAQAGCQTANGLGMLVWQGAMAFEIWTGVAPDVQVMWAAVEN